MIKKIDTIDLFPILDKKLIELLKSLDPPGWTKQTICPDWTVKDIAAHLLDGNIRRLSIQRDNYFPDDRRLNSNRDLIDFLNELNDIWVKAAKRISPNVLIELLEITGKEVCTLLENLDPDESAVFPVAWAGEKESKNWFDTAREYTEKWLHQKQIRYAVDQPGLMTKELYYPFIDTFMRALPYAYRDIISKTNLNIKVTVTSEIGGSWYLVGRNNQWELEDKEPVNFETEIFIDPDSAWKLFSKSLDKESARKMIDVKGNRELAKPVLDMVCVMA
jgi:uncharacterized protein (TIGR03083 family)